MTVRVTAEMRRLVYRTKDRGLSDLQVSEALAGAIRALTSATTDTERQIIVRACEIVLDRVERHRK